MSRDRWEPISMDDDPKSRARRTAAVRRDAALHTTGEPCPGCHQRARLSGGTGCTCPRRTDWETRLRALADRAPR